MISSSVFSLVVLLISAGTVRGQFLNASVDDRSPSVTYFPSSTWREPARTTLDFPYLSDSSHHLAVVADAGGRGAYATFEFTGAIVYFFPLRKLIEAYSSMIFFFLKASRCTSFLPCGPYQSTL